MKNSQTHSESSLRTILTALGLSLIFLVWGLFLYAAIGDKGPPAWNFGAIDDVPGLSPYSTTGPQEAPSLMPQPARRGDPVRGQHIMGPENPPSREEGGSP